MHTKFCLAAAFIASAENLRDYEYTSDQGFLEALKTNEIGTVALGYLADNTQPCTCDDHPDRVIEYVDKNWDELKARYGRCFTASTYEDRKRPACWVRLVMDRRSELGMSRNLRQMVDDLKAHPLTKGLWE
jgi:hypothetical protein